MLYQSSQNASFHLMSPPSWPLFSNISLLFNDLFLSVQNILSSFIINNLSYCYLFLIFIFSIILIILLFILVSHAQRGYSVKMNNLPNSRNENENENSKGNFEVGDSGSNGDNGDSGSNKDKPKLFLPKEEDDKNSCRIYYLVRYETSKAKNIKFMGTIKEVEDTFPDLYSEYKKYKVNNPELDWKELTDLYYCTLEKHPMGNTKYMVTDDKIKKSFDRGLKYLNRKITPESLIKEPNMNDYFHNNGSMWRQTLRKNKKDLTTYEICLEILDKITK